MELSITNGVCTFGKYIYEMVFSCDWFRLRSTSGLRRRFKNDWCLSGTEGPRESGKSMDSFHRHDSVAAVSLEKNQRDTTEEKYADNPERIHV